MSGAPIPGGALRKAHGLHNDHFGMDPDFIDAWGRHVFRFLAQAYWRIDVSGMSHVPARGRVMLAGVHRGIVPFDAIMIVHLLASRLKRYPRFLVHPGLLEPPLIRDFIVKMGGVLACQENARRVLEEDQILGVFPEGAAAAFSRYSDLYQLRKFRYRFVRIALACQTPIIPFVAVGPGEVLPVLAQVKWQWWRKKTLWPCLPVPASPLPLPTKWRIAFLPPIDIETCYPPDHAADRRSVSSIGQRVRTALREGLDGLLESRKSIFFG